MQRAISTPWKNQTKTYKHYQCCENYPLCHGRTLFIQKTLTIVPKRTHACVHSDVYLSIYIYIYKHLNAHTRARTYTHTHPRRKPRTQCDFCTDPRTLTSRHPRLKAQELCESRGGRPGLPVPNSPLYGLFGRKAALNSNHLLTDGLATCPSASTRVFTRQLRQARGLSKCRYDRSKACARAVWTVNDRTPLRLCSSKREFEHALFCLSNCERSGRTYIIISFSVCLF